MIFTESGWRCSILLQYYDILKLLKVLVTPKVIHLEYASYLQSQAYFFIIKCVGLAEESICRINHASE